jgi:adenylate cyclase
MNFTIYTSPFTIPSMGVEIERKFLVVGDHPMDEAVEMMQGYLCKDPGRTVRVRLEDEKAVITIKGETLGITRLEYEYEIPFEDARELLDLTIDSIVEKTRYHHRTDSHVWEIDVFKRRNKDEDEVFEKPSWVGEEVTHDPRYANSSLSKTPYKEW